MHAKLIRLRAQIVKELLCLLRDPKSRSIIIGPPLIQLLLFSFAITLEVKMPGVDKAVAEKIAERGHFICPYSHLARGGIEVATTLV